jgi:outer membrane protein OmpA-like peptidoglycan-associated protein
MTSFGSTILRIEGNTDSTGSANTNLSLSEKRALAVKNYIVKNFSNIPPSRFQTIGRGSSNPIAENATEAGRQQNRRTDIKVILATS